jgi:GNAT superfamily N-acetyltransferase
MHDFPFFSPRLLSKSDSIVGFDSGEDELDQYLKKHALQNQAGEGARTYVSLIESEVAGFYTLAYGSVEFEKAPGRVTKGLARHPVPVILLARVAVDKRFSGKGLGTELLRDALLRTLEAANIAGLRAVIVDAKSEAAKRFYKKFGFEPFPDNPFRLSLILKDVRRLLE